MYSLNPDDLSDQIGVGDVVIIAWVLADPEPETAVARAVKASGATLVGMFPFDREDGNAGQVEEARGLCDFAFDNLSGETCGGCCRWPATRARSYRRRG